MVEEDYVNTVISPLFEFVDFIPCGSCGRYSPVGSCESYLILRYSTFCDLLLGADHAVILVEAGVVVVTYLLPGVDHAVNLVEVDYKVQFSLFIVVTVALLPGVDHAVTLVELDYKVHFSII